jgi:hypothetical protein
MTKNFALAAVAFLPLCLIAPMARAQAISADQPSPNAEVALTEFAPTEVALTNAASVLPDAPQSQQAAPSAPQSSQTPAPPSNAQQPQDAEARKAQAERDVQAQEHQRIMGVMPAFNTTNNQNAVPLTAGQKIRLSFRSAVDPWQFGITVVAAGIGQATDSHPSWGQGWTAYSKRYAASYGDLLDGTILGNGLMPALLHQDPRFFRMGEGTAKKPNSELKRFFYAASTNFVCKGDNGHWQPNFSNVGGNIISGEISQYYYPKVERGFGLAITNAMVVTLEGAIGSELLEFWPDIHRKLFKNKDDSYTKAANDAKQQQTSTPASVPAGEPKQDAQPKPQQ